MSIKIKFVGFSDTKGGAAKALIRLKEVAALEFRVTSCVVPRGINFHFLLRLFSFFLSKLQYSGYPTKRSLNLFSSPEIINYLENEEGIAHIHWINNDTLSLFRIAKLPYGSIISLHDEWFYLGSEHVSNPFDDHSKNLHKYGYKGIYRFPLNSILMNIKAYIVRSRPDFIFTAPSNWLLERAMESKVLKDSRIEYLPNIVDTNVFRPISDQRVKIKRRFLDIGEHDFVLLFGAVGGNKNPFKGWNSFIEALRSKEYRGQVKEDIHVIIFGDEKFSDPHVAGVTFTSVGVIENEDDLVELYNIADAVVVTSYIESFGLVAAEASACSKIVVCFDTSGLKDIVVPDKTGIVVQAFDANELGKALAYLISMPPNHKRELEKNARRHICDNFSPPVILKTYKDLILSARLIGLRK